MTMRPWELGPLAMTLAGIAIVLLLLWLVR